MKEWADDNKFNSFNPWKGLLYAPQFELLAKGIVPVPIQARIDPTLRCPLDCNWCNSARYRDGSKDELSLEHTTSTLAFLHEWGVQAVVWAGGGEPTAHPEFKEMLRYNALMHMDAAILSNGVCSEDVAAEIGQLCRWAGISVDAGSPDTYAATKGADAFYQVLDNIRIMAKQGKGCDVAYKFLISPDNHQDIYEACKRAKAAGASSFVARPMDTNHQGMTGEHDGFEKSSIRGINKALRQCYGLESDTFRVYTVLHKFNADLTSTHKFSQCYGAPLRVHIAPDGNVYFCDDQFYQEKYILGRHFPRPQQILEFWGGEHHKRLLFGNTPQKCNTRCCVSDHCTICEEVFVNADADVLFRRYP